MALWGVLSISSEVKSSADKFYNLWKSQVYHLPNISGGIQNVEVHEGDWHIEGSVKAWNYTVGGKALKAKEKVSFDDANKSITFDLVDGDVLKEFKTFKAVFKASPKADGKSIVTWTIEYEKLNKSVAIPVEYLVLYEQLAEEVDGHLLKN
ncbi:hypothetical protein MLD38_003862 [Melastoma candidum]|uniref:Uncharacterized protein n=2 Tax=Melastoma candidum TaxID=119954 RepID=A0ACB9S3X2_9MYRT|nr:hypothetical protein MLD38_003859 [Melastoma candidum]KAI4385873.1 hypothetical protein MLD38_003862 [Melastoma candidum]